MEFKVSDGNQDGEVVARCEFTFDETSDELMLKAYLTLGDNPFHKEIYSSSSINRLKEEMLEDFEEAFGDAGIGDHYTIINVIFRYLAESIDLNFTSSGGSLDGDVTAQVRFKFVENKFEFQLTAELTFNDKKFYKQTHTASDIQALRDIMLDDFDTVYGEVDIADSPTTVDAIFLNLAKTL